MHCRDATHPNDSVIVMYSCEIAKNRMLITNNVPLSLSSVKPTEGGGMSPPPPNHLRSLPYSPATPLHCPFDNFVLPPHHRDHQAAQAVVIRVGLQCLFLDCVYYNIYLCNLYSNSVQIKL